MNFDEFLNLSHSEDEREKFSVRDEENAGIVDFVCIQIFRVSAKSTQSKNSGTILRIIVHIKNLCIKNFLLHPVIRGYMGFVVI